MSRRGLRKMFVNWGGNYKKQVVFILQQTILKRISSGINAWLDICLYKPSSETPSVSLVFSRMFGCSRQDLEEYCTWLSSVKKYVETDVSERFYGSKENRLFELIKE